MKKVILFIVVVALLLVTAVVWAHPGTQVLNSWSGYAWYNAAGKSGVVHERYACNSNWENCIGHWVYYKMEKHPNQPVCDSGFPASYINLWDVGDGSDILPPVDYWFCSYYSDFRAKPSDPYPTPTPHP